MAAPAKRIDGVDFWRGFGLLTIFIDHVPENVFQHVTQQNFGFSDAAELFVFLSGARREVVIASPVILVARSCGPGARPREPSEHDGDRRTSCLGARSAAVHDWRITP